ncbi:CehA/McbA family metallohydrolase [Amycolatopsis pithecellobii]|uniref:CehA/McbA family metallohydrolase n=1 Tax=Amycolatopsis pithecellobii TaxID=664692 RepID=A0A6N7YUU4_9PSEU|nr:CehA/McbA family metallohydrolase [Amycolatopsis pithecellobii]MTD55688.1 hypothetical protein [Amycolatopsis pithecellobii]
MSTTYDVFVCDKNGSVSLVEGSVSSAQPVLEVHDRTTLAVEPTKAGTLRLIADQVSRWSVVDERGGAWFPRGYVNRYDSDGRPIFHGNNLTVDVPVGEVSIEVNRGCEYEAAKTTIRVKRKTETVVELSPRRIYAPAVYGWYGGDLHVHMNYSGDSVCTPEMASLMQQGEGLHLMNLVAANWSTSLIYDEAMLESFSGRDLPWSDGNCLARCGVEYRNDILGHFHALNPAAPPKQYQSGHPRSNHPDDWPPNASAAQELRDLGATIGYTHPVLVPLDENCSPSTVFAHSRSHSYEARELVADAALGLVDSMDLGGPCHIDSTEFLYHRLLGCGLSLAATAGTDVFLSHRRMRWYSNPPGWTRAYAYLGGCELTVENWQDAIRKGRTIVTNGPWLELTVDGKIPGDRVNFMQSRIIEVTARTIGSGVEEINILGPDGTISVEQVGSECTNAQHTISLKVEGASWVAASARGGIEETPFGSQTRTYAHTSPVWLDWKKRKVSRPSDAKWCLDWLDRTENLINTKGTFSTSEHLQDVLKVLNDAKNFYERIR